MSSVERNAKIYGAVETETNITFTGFCKKIYDTEQQEVEVFIDDKKIDVISANQKISNIEDAYEVFDTCGFCFTYKLPKEYIGKKHKLEFKTINGDQLIHSPIITMDQEHPKYNENCFLESLNEPIDEEKIKDMYCPNSIGFLATEENLEDEEFVGYIKELMERFPDVEFKGFYFTKKNKNEYENIFNDLNLINITNIHQIYTEIKIFVLKGNEKEIKIRTKISSFISCIYLNLSLNYTIKDHENKFINYYKLFFDNFNLFELDKYEILKNKNSFFCIIYNKFIKDKQYQVKSNDLYSSLYVKRIKLTLENKDFENYLLKVNYIMDELIKNDY